MAQESGSTSKQITPYSLVFRFLKKLVEKLRRKSKPKTKVTKANPRRRWSFDARTKKNLATLNEKVVPIFTELTEIAMEIAEKYGITIKMISAYRSLEKQKELYAKGRYGDKSPKVTTVKVSRHCFGIAADYGCFDKGRYLDATNSALSSKIYAEMFKLAQERNLPLIHGGQWKSFPDPPHFEYRNNLTITQMISRSKKGKSIV